ncbi:MAG: hypothetical protein KAR19_10135 [Bacteroidales bacterium]|nr:hypothetical protein [Bacteroidales bacterium]
MIRRRSYSIIYKVQRIILLVFYITTAISLSIPLVRLVVRLSPDHLFPLVAFLLIYTVLVVVFGTMIYLISYIPFNLASAFDPIKNEIASGAIRNMDQLGKRITEFTTQFFDFSFLDIAHAFIQTKQSEIISHEEISGVQHALTNYDMLDKSKQLEEIIRAGKIDLNNKEYHLYILPIWFGERWLGYMGLLSEHRISCFFQKFLMEYENNFLDDQIMHVIQLSNKE